MARAKVRTWLPLDRWSQFFGINPLHFNQAYSTKYAGTNCGDVWFQYAWQHTNQVGRHEVAQAIHSAEKAIAQQVHYNLVPDWTVDELHRIPRPARRDVFHAANLNIREQTRSVELKKGYVIAPGVKVKSLVQALVPIVYSDADGDGYDELATMTVATTLTSPCEFHVYIPGYAGSDLWEIRPIEVSISGGVATITFNSWLAIDPDLQERMNAEAIDGDDAASYLTTADVYRVYHDYSVEGQMIWEPVGGSTCGCGSLTCEACNVAAQDACLGLRDTELGYVTYYPATYSDGQWAQSELAECRDADRLYASYLSGWTDPDAVCPRSEMDLYWVEAVARYSAALIDREVCSCNNSEAFINEQRRDIAAVRTGIIFQVSVPEQIANPFGTWVGAIFAWNRCVAAGRSLPK